MSVVGLNLVNAIQNQSLTPDKGRTEASRRSIEKARIGAYLLEAYGTFYGTPCWGEPICTDGQSGLGFATKLCATFPAHHTENSDYGTPV